VWCFDFHREGVFIGVNGISTDLERSVWRQVVAGRPSHVAGQPGGAATTNSGFSSSCRRMATKAQAKLGPRVKYTPMVMMILTFG
jgi:hypothetical protein